MDTGTKQEFEDLAVIIVGSFEKVDKKLEEIEQKMATKEDLAKVESRLDAKIDSVESRLDAKIDSIESRLDAKIDSIESRLGAKINGVEGSLSEKIADLKETVEKLDARDKTDTDALASDVLNLQQRVGVLEAKP